MGKMRFFKRAAWVVAVGLVAGGGVAARAQGSCTFTDESGKTVTWPNCQDPNVVKPVAPGGSGAPAKPAGKAPAAAPSAAPAAVPGTNPFPFPGEPAAPAPAANAPQTPGPGVPASKAFPFPGEPDAGSPAKDKSAPGTGDGMSDAGSSGSSSSSSSSSSGGGAPFDDPPGGPLAGDDDPAAKAAAARKAERKRRAADKGEPTGNERKAEDLDVAAFYMSGSNWRGAYLRASDAVAIDADDPEAQFAVAEAARKLGKLDEALTHYKKCLTLDPVPKTKKAAEKAVKEMAGG